MTVPTSPASGSNATDQGGDAQLPPPIEMVGLTIDGLTVRVPKGSLVIRAAELVGIEIPRFCDHPLLDPAGACRQCLVDVAMPGPDGTLRPMPKPQAACTMTASDGMTVNTQYTSPVADKAQQGIMEFLLINHPLDCPVCDKGGECPLQNQAMSAGRATSRFTDAKRTFPKPINISSQVLLDRERCILCQRCTRFSDQIAGDPFIALVERGALQQIGVYQDKPFESYFSGNTVQICPVGALTGAMYRFRSRPFDLVSTPTACEHCASGCAMRTDHRRGTVLRRLADIDAEVNEEWNCDKGRWAFQYAARPDRLDRPLVRDGGELRVASWPEAVAVAADGLRRARAAGGVGVLAGGRLTAEDAYAYSKFARAALGTNDVDFRARPHSAEEAEFLAAHVVGMGPRGGAVTYADLEKATSVLLVGFEPEEESPIVFLRLRKASRKNKTKVYAIAPYATLGLVKLSGGLIRTAPGAEAQVLRALARAEGELKIPGEALTDGAIIIAGERLAGVPGGFSALAALAESTGARLAWVPRRAGERGALEAGLLPNLLPGGRPVGDAAARVQVAHAWECEALTSAPGRDTSAMLRAAADGGLAGLVVGGAELADLPDPVTARVALERGFVVSLEVRGSDVTQLADVVLPVAPVAEKAGTFVDWEGRPRQFEQALRTPAMPDHRVLAMVADELGAFLGTMTVEQTRDDMVDLGPWTGERPAAPAVPPREPAAVAVGEGQAVLATWHHLLDAGRLQDGEPHLAGTAPLAVARLSATTASSLGLPDGAAMTVSTGRGSITLPLVVTSMTDDVVWLPTNSTGSRVRAVLGAVAGDVVTLRKGGLT